MPSACWVNGRGLGVVDGVDKDEVRILRMIESLLNQMYEYQPDRGTGGVLTRDEVEKVDVYKKKG